MKSELLETTCKAMASALTVAATALLSKASENIHENPGNPYDTSGIPAIAMCLVLLIMLTTSSLFPIFLSTLANKLLNGKLPKVIIIFFEFIPTFATAALGTIVSLAYTDNTLSMNMSIFIYCLSTGFSLTTAILLYRKPRKQA